MKFANFAFARHKVLFGYGIGFGFSIGSDAKGIGSSHLFNIDLFFNAMVMWRKWEWIAYLLLKFQSTSNSRKIFN